MTRLKAWQKALSDSYPSERAMVETESLEPISWCGGCFRILLYLIGNDRRSIESPTTGEYFYLPSANGKCKCCIKKSGSNCPYHFQPG